jgi:phosphoenolpyruvate carboxylase
MPRSASRDSASDAAAKNRPLVDDIRLLGRILGDVIREQEGHEAFELIERVRQLSVAYRLKRDASAGRVLDRLLKNLSGDQTVSVIRAFSYFSHLANIAEDRHHVRRREHHEREGHLQEGSLAMAFDRLFNSGLRAGEVAAALAQAHISPVLTAHPTEVQRKSILDAERAIAELVGERDRRTGIREREDNEALLRARVTQLWQTRMLRPVKLTVADEIENALSYYNATFLREIPRLYRDIERTLHGHAVASFLRMGHWIGGDRDGNPNVGAHTLKLALERQAEVALRHYLTEVHALGSELSISQTLAGVTPEMLAQPRPQPAPRGRAGPARAHRRLCAPGRHAARAHRHRGAAPRGRAAEPVCGCRRVPRRPAHRRSVAEAPPRQLADRAAPGAADARAAGLWFSPGDDRSAAKLGPARGGGRRAAARGAHRRRLQRAVRGAAP